MSKIERALAIAIAVVGIVLVTGTVWALATGAPAKKAARAAVPAELSSGGVYDGIGRIRAKTADGAVVVAHIAFPYDEADRPFRDELRQRRTDLRELAIKFFSSLKAADLIPAAEGSIKAALRDLFNATLSLGAISEIYLAEFKVLP